MVTICDHDPRWPIAFEDEKQAIIHRLEGHIAAAEHVGSTAVPGLAAKPTIDILVGVRRLVDAQHCIPLLANLGYEYVPEYEAEFPERRYFRKGPTGRQTYHLHMVEVGSGFWVRHLRFRNYLRAHPDAAREYELLKRQLAAQYGRQAYTEAKTPFIRGIEALAARDLQPAPTHERGAVPEMTSSCAVELLKLLEQSGIEVYVDGGWAVDALLGEHTRPHRDLDIAMPHRSVPRVREILRSRGYEDVPRPDTWECNFVLGDGRGHEVDVHSYVLDDQGHNVYGVEYTSEHLTGTGAIDGYAVRCIAPDWLVKFHSGHELDENDHADVRALCARFGIPLPPEFTRPGPS